MFVARRLGEVSLEYILHVNIQCFLSHQAELVARLRMMKVKPTMIFINETWLVSS